MPKEDPQIEIVQMIILDHKGMPVITWDIFIGLLCIVSAYFYAYMSLFGIEVAHANP